MLELLARYTRKPQPLAWRGASLSTTRQLELRQLKYALVWGTSVKHKPQKVGKDHVLQDEDIVQLVKKVCLSNILPAILCNQHITVRELLMH